MATHASSDLSGGLTRRQVPRAVYDIRSSCIGITLSIVAIVAVLIALFLV